MAPVPFIGRLHIHEYFALLASFVLLFLEVFVRTITLLLPTPVIRFFYRLSRNAFNSLSSPYSRRARNRKKAVSSPIAQADDFVELCELFGYYAEEHVVQTKDGYLLGVHRLAWKRGEESQRVNSGPGSIEKKVVYLHHGLMMNSEVWVCLTEKERCLPFMLVNQGYDVWLGNNRGNKYSKKCLNYGPIEVPFWNFSMDQFAFHDIPDSINYVLSTTNQPSLSYIGFSQGTAQAFATLSIHPTLNSKVDVFVALAPALAPPGLASGIVSSLVKSNPEVLYLAFGRRAILASTAMWQALLYPGIFTWLIDQSLSFLFGWKTLNIAPHQKLAAYPHLFSLTSTKSVVHWFQIIRNGKFQMFDDEVTGPTSFSTGSKYYKVAKFPTRNIKTPIVLVYGGSDSLVDINLMLKELPSHTIAKNVPKYEHLDLLWASDVDKLVFPHVLDALESYAQPSDTKGEALGWRVTSNAARPSLFDSASTLTPNGSQPPGYSEDERSRAYPSDGMPIDFDRPSTVEEQLDETDVDDEFEDDGIDFTDDGYPAGLAPTPSSFAHSSSLPISDAESIHARFPSSTTTPRRAIRAEDYVVRSPAASSHSTEATLTLHQRRNRRTYEGSSSRRAAGDEASGSQNNRRSANTTPRARQRARNDSPPHVNGPANASEMQHPVSSPLASISDATDQTVVRSRPEGWWSSTSSSATSLIVESPSTPHTERY